VPLDITDMTRVETRKTRSGHCKPVKHSA